MNPREAMDQALKSAVATHLRSSGFRGSLPHLRRRSDHQVCLVSVQHLSSGGSFAVEVAECGPEGFTTSWGKHIPAQKVTARDIPTPRPRLGSPTFPEGDYWFTYGPRNYEEGHDQVRPADEYESLANQVIRLIRDQAESFWQEQLARRQNRNEP